MRLFTEAILPAAALSEAAQASEDLRRELGATADAVRWVRPEAVHLTLRFLGEIDEQRTPAIRAAMTQAASATGPISLQVSSPGVFGGRRPRVLWVGLDGELDRLNRLAERLDEALTDAGFEPRQGAFRPHVTLGRVRRGASRSELAQIARTVANAPPLEAETVVTGIGLVQSQLTPTGANYRRLAVLEL